MTKSSCVGLFVVVMVAMAMSISSLFSASKEKTEHSTTIEVVVTAE
ncbi:MAG: hypothetical protein PHT40_00640 [Patescibacteria group bacterium]|nr:hypothetical protein [Patescibacteria group bacterium]